MTQAAHERESRAAVLDPPAAGLAAAAAQRSGCRIRLLMSLQELEAAEALINRTWNGGSSEISIGVLRALSKSGNFVSGAYDGRTLVGTCVGFFGSSGSAELHSHLAAVEPTHRARGVGFAMKLHQRAWALSMGTERISWTYDPLVSRNAFLNVTKLGAEPVEFLDNFYGTRHDGINAQLPTDRILVSWRLRSESVQMACLGASSEPDLTALRRDGASVLVSPDSRGAPEEMPDTGHRFALVGIPRDIAVVRDATRRTAGDWGRVLRQHLGGALDSGHRVVGFARDGFYVLDRGDSRGTGARTGALS